MVLRQIQNLEPGWVFGNLPCGKVGSAAGITTGECHGIHSEKRESVGMKITVNYGEDGKIIKQNLQRCQTSVTDDAFLGTAKAITGMQGTYQGKSR